MRASLCAQLAELERMTPLEKVRDLYRDYPQDYTFEEDAWHHMMMGVAIFTPQVIILGHHSESQDTWHVYLYVGPLAKVLQHIPFPAKWVSFRRRNGPDKRYDFEKLTKRLCALQRTHP